MVLLDHKNGTFFIVFIADPNKEDIEMTGETGYYQFLVYEGLSGHIVAQLMRNTNQIDPSLIHDLQEAEDLRLKDASYLCVSQDIPRMCVIH